MTRRKNFESGDFAGVFGGLALGVVEIGGDGDDGAVDGFAKESFRPALQFAQNECGYFGRSEYFVAEDYTNDVFACGIDTERKKFQFRLDVGGAAAH